MRLPRVKAFADEIRYRRKTDRNIVEVIRGFGEQQDPFIGCDDRKRLIRKLARLGTVPGCS